MTVPRLRPDLLAPGCPAGVEILQLTEGELPCSHVYMEAQVFAPDSRRFILHESAHAHGSDLHDPRHRYLLCDLDDNARLTPITHECGATAPSVSPDGTYLYYFVNETECGGGRLSLKSVKLDGSDRQTLYVLDHPIPGTSWRPSMIYPLSSIRSDGRKLAQPGFLGDGKTPDAPFGLMIFDLANPAVEVILYGQTWCNLHPQYCRSTDPAAMRDILVQENHGNRCNPKGEIEVLVSGLGADIHVVRDDGSDFRNLPWGRDGNEFCQGHQCWRGRSNWAITSTCTKKPAEEQLIEALPVAPAEHLGLASPGGRRNDLSRTFPQPHFFHFGTDIAGRRFVTDSNLSDPGGCGVYVADLGEPGKDALANWTCLARPRDSWQKGAHIHPFLSPDGKLAFFNSDESGRLQAYMIRGLP